MRTKDFMARLDHPRIVAAIDAAEAQTSGEIRVYLQRGKMEADPLVIAQQKFLEFGMERTTARNAVLILVAPRAQKFAVVGDQGVHAKCGDGYWRSLVETMQGHFKKEDYTEAVVHAIAETGKLLARHFPRRANDRDELPNAVMEE